MTRGRDQLARTIRSFEVLSHHADWRRHAARLQPCQQDAARLDQYTLMIDLMIRAEQSNDSGGDRSLGVVCQ